MRDHKQGQPLITFHNVTLQLRDRRILYGLNWTIRSNERWAIVGGNGSGKSVLARALYGAVPVVAGEIEHHLPQGEEVGNEADRLPEDFISHVSFEDQKCLLATETSYHQSRWNSAESDGVPTVLDLLSNAREGNPPAEDACRSRADRARRLKQNRVISRLGILHLLERKLVHLSNGEIRKVLIAQALLRSPLILVLDEPFIGLDYRSRRALSKIIGELTKEDAQVIIATSQINELPHEITHVLMLANGSICAAGDKETVLGIPKKQPVRVQPTPTMRPAKTERSNCSLSKPAVLVQMGKASVAYGGVRVLRKISWTVKEGQNWVVLGPNGSGKTTLLSLILADNPQAYVNDIRLFGRQRGSGESIWDIKKEIGSFSTEMLIHYQKGITSYNVVCSGFFDSIGLYTRCSNRQLSHAVAWMKALGLSHLADRRFDELSAGQQRMALLARASVKRPRLLVLDEPCQGLDPENRKLVLELIDVIIRGRTSLIYVTHRLDEIPSCITHMLRLRKGRVTAKGEQANLPGR